LPRPPVASTLSLHDALPIWRRCEGISLRDSTRLHHRRVLRKRTLRLDDNRRRSERLGGLGGARSGLIDSTFAADHRLIGLYQKPDRKSTRLNSSHVKTSYAV